MSVKAKLVISFGAMTALIVAMAVVTALVSYLHTQDDPGAGPGWVILASAMAITGVISGATFVYIANRDITRNIGEVVRVARAVEVGDLGQIPRIETEDEFADLGRAVRGVTAYLQALADYAQEVAAGHLDARVTPRSDRDVLGMALHEMASNLRELVDRASDVESLRRLDETRRELLNNVSHNLRTPLGIIKGAVSSILEADRQLDPEELNEYLEMADSECDFLDTLVTELLQSASLGHDSLPDRREPTDLVRLAESVVRRASALFNTHSVRVMPPDGAAQVLIDPEEVRQVLLNLLENATKYSPRGTEVVISLDIQPDNVTLGVADHGPGIDPSYHDRIFERFFRTPPDPAVGSTRGTGLGLAIARGLVEQNNGNIWVESQPGHGSTFKFSLPRLEM